MWQKEKKDNSIVSLALLLALTTTPMAVNLVVSESTLAQSSDVPSFPLPSTVPSDTMVRIDGSSSMAVINQILKEKFEKQFAGSKVEVAASGTDAALKALQSNQVDIVAIDRGLTPEEKAQGLEQVRLRREKIAIIVSADNPFQRSLTDRQFARIFRGRITDWSQLGGAAGRIRFIDRPATSNVRESFRNYPVFKNVKFATGSNAIQLTEDNTVEVVQHLGKDGISYALANQVSKLPGVRVLKIHETLPEDAKYPFSQPFVYVYKKNSSPNVTNFLGFVTNSPGQKAVEEAMGIEAEVIAASVAGAVSQTTNPTNTATSLTTPNAQTNTTTDNPTSSPTTEATTAPIISPTAAATNDNPTDANTSYTNSTSVTATDDNQNPLSQLSPWWLLLPASILGIGGSLVWWSGRKSKNKEIATESQSNINPSLADNHSHAMAGVGATSLNQTENFSSNTESVATGAVFTSKLSDTFPDTAPADMQSPENGVSSANTSALEWETPMSVVNNSYAPLPDVWEDTIRQDTSPTEATSAYIEQPELPEVSLEPEIRLPEESAAVYATSDVQLPPVEVDDISEQPELPEVSLEPEIGLLEENIVPPQADQELSAEVALDLEEPVTVVNTYAPLPDVWEDTPPEPLSNPEITPPVTEEPSELEISALSDTPAPELPEISENSSNVMEDETNLNADIVEPSAEALSVSNSLEQTNQAVDHQEAEPAIGTWATIYGIHEDTNSNVIDETTSTGYTASLNADNSIVLMSRTPKWAYVCWQASEAAKGVLRQQGGSQFTLRLYDVTDLDLSYQSPLLVQQYECEETINDRYVAIPVGDRSYMAEVGYFTDDNNWLLLARSPIARIFNRPDKDFWFIADAELIIHGATEPGSSVSLAGHNIKLKPDGTFHLRIPFTDKVIEYEMTAIAADGQHSKSVRMQFSQNHPQQESNS